MTFAFFWALQLRPLAVPRAEKGEAWCGGWDAAWICVGGRAAATTCAERPIEVVVRPDKVVCGDCICPAGSDNRTFTATYSVPEGTSWFYVLGCALAGVVELVGCGCLCYCRRHGGRSLGPRRESGSPIPSRSDIVERAHRSSPFVK